jgi:hypothetical protein
VRDSRVDQGRRADRHSFVKKLAQAAALRLLRLLPCARPVGHKRPAKDRTESVSV